MNENNRKFECHITLLKPKTTKEAKILFDISSRHSFKCSWITGDPVLGVGKWFYISGYDKSFDVLLSKMKNVVMEVSSHNIEIVREKIEEILYDTKTGHFQCGVNCFACLID